MRFKFSLLVATLFLVLFSFGAGKAEAISPSAISIDMAPENPSPNENVTISLNSYAVNLDSINITWSVNGKTLLSGIGKKSFSITAGPAGSETKVIIGLGLPDGLTSKSVTIRPAVMTLLWQANDSYAPPFYKGKTLISQGSEVKVVSIPEVKDGKTNVDPKNMTYSWQKNYTNDPNGSGYGKNYFIYTDDFLENSTAISVVASTISQKYSSEGNISPTSTTPSITFYKKDPSMGTLWDQALGDGHVILGSETIVAAPYYLSPKTFSLPTLVFRWYINGEMVDVKNYFKNYLPIKVENGASGVSSIRLDIESTDQLYSTASKEIKVGF